MCFISLVENPSCRTHRLSCRAALCCCRQHVTAHMPTYENKMRMTVGSGAKQSVQHVGSASPSYWTAYRASHHRLGLQLGPGEPKGLPIRQAYNPLTGQRRPSYMQSTPRSTQLLQPAHQLRQTYSQPWNWLQSSHRSSAVQRSTTWGWLGAGLKEAHASKCAESVNLLYMYIW